MGAAAQSAFATALLTPVPWYLCPLPLPRRPLTGSLLAVVAEEGFGLSTLEADLTACYRGCCCAPCIRMRRGR